MGRARQSSRNGFSAQQKIGGSVGMSPRARARPAGHKGYRRGNWQRAAVEAVERRLLLATTLQYFPIDAKGGAGPAVNFNWDVAQSGRQVVDFDPGQRALLPARLNSITSGSGLDLFLRLDGVPGESP